MKRDDYRPLPFWSWNEKLNPAETKRQAHLMKEKGFGGYFMHARGGLETPYMGESWMENIAAGIEVAGEEGMAAWAYDENGWPSGVGDGIVCALGEDYCQKWLCIEEGEGHTPQTLINTDGYHLYYKVNPNYVDTLNIEATRAFIREIYEKYYARFGKRLAGFFTDEPQVKRGYVPWSHTLPAAYEAAYGEKLLPLLPQLFYEYGAYKTTRLRFWKLISDLFSENYFRPLYEWCDARGLKFTGHLIYEEDYRFIPTSGAIMPHYAYFHIPGIDCLGKEMVMPMAALGVGSVAHQLGKKQVLTESFGCAGHNIGLARMKGILQSQAVRGVTLLCQHLAGYSIRGLRKRDHPPALFYQQPFWEDYDLFNTYAAAMGEILGEGEVRYDTLFILPIAEAWTLYNGTLNYDGVMNDALKVHSDRLQETIRELEEKHILFHLGDETLLEKYGRVEGDTLILGTQRYKRVILMSEDVLFGSTRKLLSAFRSGGGITCKAGELDANPILHHAEILHTVRYFGDKKIYFFTNTADGEISEEIPIRGVRFDAVTHAHMPFDGTYTFAPYEGIFVACEEEKQQKNEGATCYIHPEGTWQITEASPNLYTLDFCDVYMDGALIEKNSYVLNVQQWAVDKQKPVDITLLYHIKADYLPRKLFLLCETPHMYRIYINDRQVLQKPEGYYIDTSFEKINIADYFQKGENTIRMEMHFALSEEGYRLAALAGSAVEVRNKLTYEMEVEPIYLAGDFSLRTDDPFEEREDGSSIYAGEFVLEKPKSEITLSHVERQGFPFFAGMLTVEKKISGCKGRQFLDFTAIGFETIEILVNGKTVQTHLWPPYRTDLTDFLEEGENTLTLRLRDNLFNLLGPHHWKESLRMGISPGGFFKETCVWNRGYERPFINGYCFAERSILKKEGR